MGEIPRSVARISLIFISICYNDKNQKIPSMIKFLCFSIFCFNEIENTPWRNHLRMFFSLSFRSMVEQGAFSTVFYHCNFRDEFNISIGNNYIVHTNRCFSLLRTKRNKHSIHHTHTERARETIIIERFEQERPEEDEDNEVFLAKIITWVPQLSHWSMLEDSVF